MNTILTDDERLALAREHLPNWQQFSIATEAAVLAKLREQGPVGVITQYQVDALRRQRLNDPPLNMDIWPAHVVVEGDVKLYATPQPAVVQVPRTLTDEECDKAAAQTMDRVGAAKRLHALEINPDVTAHHTLRRELIRAGYALAATPEAPALPAEVREVLKVAREALGKVDTACRLIPEDLEGYLEPLSDALSDARAALARIDALGGVE